MLVSELIESVRDQLLERNINPITDRLIVNRLNDAYRFVYNNYAKSNDNMFGENYYLQINSGQSEYELPKGLWNKRIETFEVPNPPTGNGQNPKQVFSYLKIDKTDRRQMSFYDMPAYNSIIPTKWAQFGNKLRIMPPPSLSYLARMFQIPALVKLGVPQGRILDIARNVLTLDNGTTAELEETLAGTTPFISISDFQTGALKAVYSIESANGTQITLGSSTREQFQGTPVLSVKSANIPAITYANGTLTATVGTHSFKVGDVIEIARTLDTSLEYRIQVGVQSSYNVPEIVSLTDDKLSTNATITSVTNTTISWSDAKYQPLFVDGYVATQTPNTVTVTSATAVGTGAGSYFSVIFATTIAGNSSVAGGAWNLKIGDKIKLNLSGAGSFTAGLNTAQYVSATVVQNNRVNLFFQATAAGDSGFVGTANLAPLATGWTGTPQFKNPTSNTVVYQYGDVFANTPKALFLTDHNLETPNIVYEKYKIGLDDIVTLGVSTGCSIFGEAFGQYLWKHALLSIRGSLNENDPEINKQMRDVEKEITGDTAGRPLGRKIERTFGPGNNYQRPRRG